MTCLPSSDVFQSIEIRAVELGVPELELFGTKLAEVRQRLALRYDNVFEANAWWRGLIEESRRRPDPWRFAALWASVLRLRNMMWEIHRITGLDRDECQSELVLGALETLAAIEFDAEDLGKAFVTLSARTAWELGRGRARGMKELGWDGNELLSMPAEIPPPSKRIERLLDARRFLLTSKQLTGERFGMIAVKLRLTHLVHRPEIAVPGVRLDFIKLFGLPQFVDIGTAARAYGISLKTAYLWIRQRRLPFAAFRDGRIYRIPTSSLATSMGICMDEIDLEDVLSGVYFAQQYYESPDDDNPFG